ncbi:MAG: polyphosphate:AMP phosphotransferase [Pirellulales bacterium]|nr:polyphosphate:AMP phosphotransferase [Pirellulales bacterium]
MLEFIDLGKKISKSDYAAVMDGLEARLGECQRAAQEAGVPVVLVFEGWDAAGKGEAINRLAQVLDPRGFRVNVVLTPNEEERYRPWMWRFWNELPPAGKFALFDHSWYSRVLRERLGDEVSESACREAYEEIRQFERQLADFGAVLVKFWLHIDRKEQKKRFRALEKDPATAWRVGESEWQQNQRYDVWRTAAEEMLEETSAGHSPWVIVEATQRKFVEVKVVETVVVAVEKAILRRASAPKPVYAPMPKPQESPTHEKTVLDRFDLGLTIDREDYERRLGELQERLFRLEHELYVARIPAVIVYEGWDAAGKGGNIKRLTRGLDPRGYEVIPVGPPNEEEKLRPYLWRFWRSLPKAGHIAIFDRSWYGRVLVERVEGYCTEEEWRRAYREITEFERQLADFGTVLVKFWLQIDPEEQLRRFQAREEIPQKKWKITTDDWRNREKWDQYRVSVVDMLQRTSTTHAPWTVLEANDKLYARIKALRTVAEALERAIAGRGTPTA